jgi:hypothetical protein
MLVPTTLSPTETAAITGRSRKAINGMIDAGLLPAEGRVHRRIPVAAVEVLIGREVTPALLAAAEIELAHLRATQRAYNERRGRPPEPGYVGA